jgi:hypothetical protein
MFLKIVRFSRSYNTSFRTENDVLANLRSTSALAREHVAVGVRRDSEVPLPDVLADPRPGMPAR